MILCVDSSGIGVQFSIAEPDGHELATVLAAPRSELSRDMSAMFAQVLDAAGMQDGTAIKRIVAGQGPGTFIGTRVALSFANGLAAAGGLPVASFDSLAALRLTVGDPSAISVRDARRGQFYVNDGGESRIIDEEQLVAIVAETTYIVSDAVPPELHADRSLAHMQDLLAFCTGRLGWLERTAPKAMIATAEPCEDGYAEPVYLRDYL
ncbi:MAG: hypothetical protein H7A35_10920 [Planctomycetales bacterium]|nr:hypothetical protein [bacterium]UNM07380.1 MAG: hypothetical protein H7A35_10920 [Planctomycetales bacterium]